MVAFAGELATARGQVAADDVFTALVRVIKHVDSSDNKVELGQISRQGVARFMGVKVACRTLEVVADDPERVGLCDTAGPFETFALGCGGPPVYVAQTCPEALRKFVRACNEHDAEFTKLLRDIAVSAQGVVTLPQQTNVMADAINDACALGWTRYTKRNMVRKILISWLRDCLCATAGQSDQLRWQDVAYAALDEAGSVADASRTLAKLTEASAAEVSDLVLGRRDHALFVSMWACCFSEVETTWDDDGVRKRMLELLKSPRAADLVGAFRREHGVPPCPVVLARLLLQEQ